MADAWGILMMLFFLSHECFAQFALDPNGVVRVCTGQNQQFMCTSGGASWAISGFSNGISDATQATAFLYAPNNIRVMTTDDTIISAPSTLTFMMLGYPDDNARVTCSDIMGSSVITGTIRIGPPSCTVDFSAMASGVSIIVNLTVYACVGYLPMYEVVLSTTGNEQRTMSIATPPFMASTILRISDQKPLSDYNVSLKLVDPYCQNSTVATRLVVTDVAPTGTDPNTSSNSSLPANFTGTQFPPEAVVGIVIAVLIIIVVAGVIIVLIIFVYWKKKQSKSPIAERMTVASDANSKEMGDRKEQNKKEELNYVTVEHENAPPAEPKKPKQAEAVQYTGVKFAQS